MTISEDQRTKILRYHHVEKWPVGTISRVLNVHHSTVKRVLSQTGVPRKCIMPGISMFDPYVSFVLDALDKYPNLTASRLYHMVQERGYPGGPDHFRHLISLHRARPAAEAYLRLRTLPGEQAQVDWGHFGHVIIGKAKRPLIAFVMVLSYSRKIFLRFYLNQQMANFLRGHEAGFNAFGGVPKVLLYDNLKSAVLERTGDAIRFHPTLLEFAGHYRFEPRPVAIARGNEKGRVERAIRYIRDNFFAACQFKDIDDLNAQAAHWCDGPAANRACPEDLSQSVQAIFKEEQPQLIALPDNLYPTDEREDVHVGKTPYVRFDLNDYSIPHTHVRRTLKILATPVEVRIVDGSEIIAKHPRTYDKGQQIEDESHIRLLTKQKQQARQHRAQNRLTAVVPSSIDLLKQAAARGYSLRAITRALILLLEEYGAAELEMAIADALRQNVPHPNVVRISLKKHREQRHQLPPIRLDLPNDKRIQEQIVRVHNLSDYDQLRATIKEVNNDE